MLFKQSFQFIFFLVLNFKFPNFFFKIGKDQRLVFKLLVDRLVLFNQIVLLLLNSVDLLLSLCFFLALLLHHWTLAEDSALELFNFYYELPSLSLETEASLGLLRLDLIEVWKLKSQVIFYLRLLWFDSAFDWVKLFIKLFYCSFFLKNLCLKFLNLILLWFITRLNFLAHKLQRVLKHSLMLFFPILYFQFHIFVLFRNKWVLSLQIL